MQWLEERCLVFALNVRDYCRSIKFDTVNDVYKKQLVRSSSSIGANYIEANEALGDADRIMKVRISRKEAKESLYWLKLLDYENEELNKTLQNEAEELKKILSSIIKKLNTGSSQ